MRLFLPSPCSAAATRTSTRTERNPQHESSCEQIDAPDGKKAPTSTATSATSVSAPVDHVVTGRRLRLDRSAHLPEVLIRPEPSIHRNGPGDKQQQTRARALVGRLDQRPRPKDQQESKAQSTPALRDMRTVDVAVIPQPEVHVIPHRTPECILVDGDSLRSAASGEKPVELAREVVGGGSTNLCGDDDGLVATA